MGPCPGTLVPSAVNEQIMSAVPLPHKVASGKTSKLCVEASYPVFIHCREVSLSSCLFLGTKGLKN